jgi:chromosome partitioning protein
MAHVVAVANQKGGVAKTTTVQALGVALAERGERILLVDLDPQACLTYSFGLDPDTLDVSMHDVLVRRAKVDDVRRPVPGVEGLHLAPATIDLAGAEVHLLSRTAREHVLARALEPVLDDHDLILIDCPPSLGVLTINGLTAADSVLIPLQCEALSHRGVGQLLETIDDVRTFANADLAVLGVVATMYDARTRHAREILRQLPERYQLVVLGPPVPKSVRFAEAPALGLSILQHAPDSPGSLAYRLIAAELATRLALIPRHELEGPPIPTGPASP